MRRWLRSLFVQSSMSDEQIAIQIADSVVEVTRGHIAVIEAQWAKAEAQLLIERVKTQRLTKERDSAREEFLRYVSQRRSA